MKQRAHKTLLHIKLNALMLQLILYTREKHDASVSMKLPAYSPYYPEERHTKICLREHNILPAEDGLKTDVRIKYT